MLEQQEGLLQAAVLDGVAEAFLQAQSLGVGHEAEVDDIETVA